MGKANIHLFHHLTNTCQVSNVCQVVLGMVIQQWTKWSPCPHRAAIQLGGKRQSRNKHAGK